MKKKKIAIFASGNGSNAQNIIEYFRDRHNATVSMVLTNNPGAYVIKRAELLKVPCIIFNRQDLFSNGKISSLLIEKETDLIVLAGFLWLIPENIVSRFSGRIVNIHPALLPGYGGPGMYGMKVHRAVIDSGDRESGISIHYVNEKYDEGGIIFQAKCPVYQNDTPETLADRVHRLEYLHYPSIIEQIIRK